MGIVEDIGKAQIGLGRPRKRTRRSAPGLNGGALPRTPASFTLSETRYAGLGMTNGVCCGKELNRGASRWFRPAVDGGVGRLSPGSDWQTDAPDFGPTALRSPITAGSGKCPLRSESLESGRPCMNQTVGQITDS